MARVNCFKLEFLPEFVKEDNMHFSFLFLYYLKLGENFSYYYCHSNNLRALLVIR